jgi:hypothetical protein
LFGAFAIVFRRFGSILFGVLAAFRSAFWQLFVRRFGGFSFGVLAIICSAIWHEAGGKTAPQNRSGVRRR